MRKTRKSSTLAKNLKKSGVIGEPGLTDGLHPEWAEVEHIVHDVCHNVTLGLKMRDRDLLGSNLIEIFDRMPDSIARNNEEITLASQMTFFRRMRAFKDSQGEAKWLKTICSELKMSPKIVLRMVETPFIEQYARKLERRLRYYASNPKVPS